MAQPLVIGHRGACGYRPENTIESFELAISQQADGIEFDVVSTSDSELIIRHENALSGTTDVAIREEFEPRKRTGRVDDREVVDWFSEDFSKAEIKTLRAIERLPDYRPGSAVFDGQFAIPSLQEVVQASFLKDRLIVAELKDGTHLKKLGKPIAELFAQSIAESNVTGHLVVESFNRNILEQSKIELENRSISAKYFYLLEQGTADYLEELIGFFDGISISLEMLFADLSWVEKTQQLGKQIWVYTARAEQAEASIEEYYLRIIDSGVDGIFADQPDLLRRVLADSRGSAYDY